MQQQVFKLIFSAALGLVISGLAPVTARAAAEQVRMSAAQLFGVADRLKASGRLAEAETIYDALVHDPDSEIRAEARFRLGMMLAGQKRYREAAVAFRALVDEKPGASRVRLELARVLALMGEESAARRQLREAEAAGLPPEVRIVVDQFAGALRSRKRFGGSIELALAPDTNINRATDARTLDTVIAPLTLSEDARAKSGIGFRVSGQAYARIGLGDHLSLVPRISGLGNLYRRSEFDDISGSALAGLEWQSGRDKISPSIGQTWRWYGNHIYAHTQSLTMDWLHPAGQRAQFDVQVSANRARYKLNDLQDGAIYSGSVSYERALTPRFGASLSLDANRQTARDPGYATWSGGATLLVWRDAGRTSLFASAGIHRLLGDERLFLFPDRRCEWLYQLSGGATLRKLAVAGFAPVVRYSLERNKSTVGLYDYKRATVQFGVTGAF